MTKDKAKNTLKSPNATVESWLITVWDKKTIKWKDVLWVQYRLNSVGTEIEGHYSFS